MNDETKKPFWWPDALGFTIGAIIFICAVCVFYRMTHPSPAEDKLLDMMLTILFSTCLAAIVSYQVGSSRGSSAKDDVINKIAAPPPASPAPPAVVVAWWSLLTETERLAIAAGAANDTRAAAFLAAAQAGRATPDDLAYLVTAGLLTQERAVAIQAA